MQHATDVYKSVHYMHSMRIVYRIIVHAFVIYRIRLYLLRAVCAAGYKYAIHNRCQKWYILDVSKTG